jgi:hypothetical protein
MNLQSIFSENFLIFYFNILFFFFFNIKEKRLNLLSKDSKKGRLYLVYSDLS